MKTACFFWHTSEEKALQIWNALDFFEEGEGISSCFEREDQKHWCVQILFHEVSLPDQEKWDTFCLMYGFCKPDYELWPCQNWLQKNREDLSPISIGSFYIHNHYHPPHPQKISLCIEAKTAFGSGYHPTTQGCLQMLEFLFLEDPWHTALDLGCGSGILTIAMDALVSGSVMGSDEDPEAVRVSYDHALANKKNLDFYVSRGFSHPELQKPFDLIIANILLNPLLAMSEQMLTYAQRHIILSGFLEEQEEELYAVYSQWTIQRRISLDKWITLLLKKP